MNADSPKKILSKFAELCIECGCCLPVCDLLSDLGLNPAEIARRVAAGETDQETVDTILRCALCGLCSQECLVDLKPQEMMMAARELLMQAGKISTLDYEVMLVDREWNYFSIYRDTFGIHFEDLKKASYETLFFPGCTLGSYTPELTRAVYAWLADQGMQLGFTEMCCGKPLASIGLRERKESMLAVLLADMRRAGAKRLVTACPNCYYQLSGHLGEMKVYSLYDLLSNAEVRLRGEQSLTVHDSCPDRYGVSVGTQVRTLLSGFELLEMQHHGEHTICCGSGGIVSMIDADLCQERAQKRVAEYHDTGASACVTACMACAHRLARQAQPGEIVHCLELVFNLPVDYAQIEANTHAMWAGEWGEYNLYRLSHNQEALNSLIKGER